MWSWSRVGRARVAWADPMGFPPLAGRRRHCSRRQRERSGLPSTEADRASGGGSSLLLSVTRTQGAGGAPGPGASDPELKEAEGDWERRRAGGGGRRGRRGAEGNPGRGGPPGFTAPQHPIIPLSPAFGGNPLSVGTAEHGAHKAGPWVCPSIPAPGSAAAAGGGFLGGSPAARD